MAVTPFDRSYVKSYILHAHFTVLWVIDAELLEFLHCAEVDLSWHAASVACVPVVDLFSVLWPWPWPDDPHIRTWPLRCTGCANMNFLHQGFRKLSSDRQTQNRPNTTRLRGWSLTKYNSAETFTMYSPAMQTRTESRLYCVVASLWTDWRR